MISIFWEKITDLPTLWFYFHYSLVTQGYRTNCAAIFSNCIPLRRFALKSVDCDAPLAVLNGDLFDDDDDDDDKTADGCKVEWENRYNATLSDFAAELALLDSAPCCLTFSSEDASRSWHGRDGQPMPLWTAPSSAAAAVAMMESGACQVSRMFVVRSLPNQAILTLAVMRKSTDLAVSGRIFFSHCNRTTVIAVFFQTSSTTI